ncbi:MAG: FMN-binding glutamate synthase family protein [Bdellovibrio sp. CG12_big_fil_rev_8_21_14_0_65_39_13]|nr:MAG: FMN-binding glutamate synthase family protein [Bdellovibrio sp. CG22_combo_CG10-13_8_21_14_all_39_27]PIQ58746.1 MAG: FMN-binding glutamate synthase family protein [Bdellovibrio sp. CG12_big_fil_rev_8_21_14_0_65_39_13]PIR35573.1 MAG: FMN-binding glutamate synthase family protein [Bdellovibrio sp. CG11_big_fil_rev_8_21_14_0_20_39_38]PJB54089.1 MAG: FMN-binding glutamate synthase family protein [Bdellovibrio sp. CG_4_9_14_3_um_filter_39_7]
MRKQFYWISFIVLTLQAVESWYYHPFAWTFLFTLPTFAWGMFEAKQTSRTLLRNYPILGRGRYIMEILRPKIYQYFIESDTDGTPISRIYRSVVYQRAKEQLSSTPFGTQLDVYQPGYEWINHSIYPKDLRNLDTSKLRIVVGGRDCKQPYNASILNISAMSFGALSPTAIESLNWGAKDGGFSHNTGEGGISPYHLKHGGDLIWQIGTGYFGCRDDLGNFLPEAFKERAHLPNVKMIEIKLSQGAKPGHGGILPKEKNTPEIAKIRLVKPHTSVHSPSCHTAFSGAEGLLQFVKQLRDLSGGKPVGFKLCLGQPEEFQDICKAMVKTQILPDFITVDGGEGGTGAAPLEFSNFVGTPLRDGLVKVVDLLKAYNLRSEIKVIASGKILTGFDIVRTMALGADMCNSARGMMLALGCIQALTCNSNHCPTGVATQAPHLFKGLVVTDKFKRVSHFHQHTLEAVAELIAAAGLDSSTQLTRSLIWRRLSPTEVRSYSQIYPDVTPGSSLDSMSA